MKPKPKSDMKIMPPIIWKREIPTTEMKRKFAIGNVFIKETVTGTITLPDGAAYGMSYVICENYEESKIKYLHSKTIDALKRAFLRHESDITKQ